MAQEIRYWLQEAIKNDPVLSDREHDNIMFLPFDILNVLEPEEPKYDEKGVKRYKNYYYCFTDENGDEQEKLAVKIRYEKIYEDREHEGTVINNVWTKTQRLIDFYRVDGLVTTKEEKPQRFHLEPVFKGDGTGTLIGFSSLKLRKYLKQERYSADEDMQANNLDLYQLIYSNYKDQYNDYLQFGDKTALATKMDEDNDFDLSPFIVNGEIDNSLNDYENLIRIQQLQQIFSAQYRETPYTILQAIKGALQ